MKISMIGKNRKDYIFMLIIFLWILTSIIGYYVDHDYGIGISNIIWTMLISILVLFKLSNKKFARWLETNNKKK